MEDSAPIYTAHLFLPLHEELIALLDRLSPGDWLRPTICRGWAVRDIAAHLLDVQIRQVSAVPPPDAPITSYSELVAFLNRLNAEWITAARRISPELLVAFLKITGPRVAAWVEALDMHAPARFPVDWAGETQSATWFDVAREYTEHWHHQQQIRDAVNAPALDDARWLAPVLDTFVRALPHTYRDTKADNGTAVVIEVEGKAGGVWSLVAGDGKWSLHRGAAAVAACTIRLSQDSAWRLFTKGLSQEQAAKTTAIEGRHELGAPFLRSLAIMA